MIPFRVEIERHKLQIESFKKDFETTRSPDDFVQAARYCLDNNIELEQALAWMERGIYFRIMGEKNFRTLSTKAAILTKLNRNEEAKKIMEEAIPLGNIRDVHFYGRTLINSKQTDEAFKVFKFNYDKFPSEFTTNVGLGRAYSAKGDYKKALEHLKIALPKAPDNLNKNGVETMIKKLEEGKDVN